MEIRNGIRIIMFITIISAGVFGNAQLRPDIVFDSTYEAVFGLLPEEASPSWMLIDNVHFEKPSLSGGRLTLSTSRTDENTVYRQSAPNIVAPDPLIIEARVKFTSGTSSNPLSAAIVIMATTARGVGNGLYIGEDEIFCLEDKLTKGESASVDTNDAFHTYRMEISWDGSVEVFYDDVPTFSGSTFFDLSTYGEVERVLWGDVSASGFGISEWEFVRHNAYLRPVEISVICVGDIMLAGNAKPVIEWYGVDYPFDGTRAILQGADLTIGNLEMPVAMTGEPVREKEYTFLGQPKIVKGLANAGFDVLALANNHMGDYGDGALLETLEILTANQLRYCGAGPDLETARQPAIVEVNDKQIAVLAYSNTFPFEYFAGESDPGTVRGKAEYFVPDIKAAKEWADLVIVSFHWSGELITEPREYQELYGRKVIDAGADLVFGHHPHILQGVEVYKGRLIAYSLGNFAFGSYSRNVQTSAILRVTFQARELKRAEIIPINVANHEVVFQPRRLLGDAAEAVIDEVRTLSEKWGTQITMKGDLGIIQLKSQNPLKSEGE